MTRERPTTPPAGVGPADDVPIDGSGTAGIGPEPPPGRRWLARASMVLMVAAAGVLIGFTEGHGIGLVVIGVGGVCLVVAGAYWFLANRGPLRWLSLALVVGVPIAIVVVYARNNLLWVAIVSVGLAVASIAVARAALTTGVTAPITPGTPVAPPRRAFIVMNPRAGGGKVARFGLKEKAEAAGARVAMLEGPEHVDVEALARKAVADGCDVLGVAGGDGTQALVAGVAAELDIPLLVISAGTRNHLALDLGLDRDDPSTCLDALTDGVEIRVDLGVIGGRPFVNNASFGAYAEVVQSPAYRADKRGTTLKIMPDVLKGHRGARITARFDDETITEPQALLVSNNPYERGDIAGLGRRARLDTGTLGVIAVRADSARHAVALLRRGTGHGLTFGVTTEIIVTADTPDLPVGVDGETVTMRTPVVCIVRPGVLRVLLPRHRPGVPPPKPTLDWPSLRRLAGFRGHTPSDQ